MPSSMAVGAGEACRSQGLKTSVETETGGEGAVRADDSSAENPKETEIQSSSNSKIHAPCLKNLLEPEGREERGKRGSV